MSLTEKEFESKVDQIVLFTDEVIEESASNLQSPELARVHSSKSFKSYQSDSNDLDKELSEFLKHWSVYLASDPKNTSFISGSLDRLQVQTELVEIQNENYRRIIETRYASLLINFCDAMFAIHDSHFKVWESMAKEAVELKRLIEVTKSSVKDAKIYAALKTLGDAVDLMSNFSGPWKIAFKIGKAGYDRYIYDTFGPETSELARQVKHVSDLAKKGTKRPKNFKAVEAVKSLQGNVSKVVQLQQKLDSIRKKYSALEHSFDRMSVKLEQQSQALDRTIVPLSQAMAVVAKRDNAERESAERYRELKRTLQ